MKYLNVQFTEEEFTPLLDLKEELNLNWHDLLLELAKNYRGEKGEY